MSRQSIGEEGDGEVFVVSPSAKKKNLGPMLETLSPYKSRMRAGKVA